MFEIQEALATVRSSELSTDDLLNVVLQSDILDQMQLLNLMKENSQNTTSRTPCKHHLCNQSKSVTK